MPFLSTLGGGSSRGFNPGGGNTGPLSSTSGDYVTTDGGYKYHFFNTNGTFVNTGGGGTIVEIFCVGGGGGGSYGGANAGGGGGGGLSLIHI